MMICYLRLFRIESGGGDMPDDELKGALCEIEWVIEF